MKAIVITRTGGPEVLEVREVAEPRPAAGQTLVRVVRGGLNFADLMTAQGGYPGAPKPPLIAGREFAGVEESTGRRVMGYTQWSAFAEKTAAQPELLWPVPEGWSYDQAAAFPVNYFTAYFAYWEAGVLSEPRGKRVLIHAVAGGVGTAAVEVGKVLGVEMYGTSSSEDKLARVKELGLQHAINYTKNDYEDAIRDLWTRFSRCSAASTPGKAFAVCAISARSFSTAPPPASIRNSICARSTPKPPACRDSGSPISRASRP
jgi:NADPH2:quinone reductase